MDPNWLLDRFGAALFWISLVIVFVECGLFFPILPGDTLLFALGLFIATGQLDLFPGPPFVELLIAMALLIVAAFLGNVVGYEIGRKLGPPLYERDGRIIKRKYFDQTTAFFDKHGNKALVIGRFVPFVRTYITVVAGRDPDGPRPASSSGASSARCCGCCRSPCSASSSATRSPPSARASTS